MKIYFGLRLDDSVYPSIIDKTQTTAGVQYFGEQQLLNFLEIHLGLVAPSYNNDHLRIEEYRQAVLQYLETHPDAFFYASFEADQLATTAALLSRRDELILAGWDFTYNEQTPERLKNIAHIEKMLTVKGTDGTTVSRLSAGFSDRLVAVIKQLEITSLPVSELFIQEPFEILPFYLQRLFSLLEKKGIPLNYLKTPIFEEKTDLQLFQKALHNHENGKRTKNKVRADGSLIILKAKRETDAAEFLAKLFKKNPTFRPVCLIPEKNRVLDNALIQEGLPSLGIQSASLARPVLQILKLAPTFLWRPIDPFKIMEFVSLSVKPLHSELASLIATEMAQTPGIRSERWNIVINSFFNDLEKRASQDTSIDVGKIRQQYDFWFTRKRYDISQTVPKNDVIEIFEYVRNWANKEYDQGTTKQQSLRVLSEQAKRITELLAALPDNETQLTSLQLERIVRTIYEPSPITFKPREVGYLPYVHHSSSIIDKVKDLVWWNFTDMEANHFFPRWYQNELAFFKANHLHLETPQYENARLLWQRPQSILHTENRLILVIPEMIDGTETKFHPLFSDLTAIFDDLDMITFWAIPNKNNTQLHGFTLPQTVKISAKTLGKPKPYLTLPNGFNPREKETFTSLDTLFYYPHQWVFKHQLELRKTSILSIAKEHRLMGNLAHRIFETLFSQHKEEVLTWNKVEVQNWVGQAVTRLLEREGAVLLMYGKEPEKVDFINTIKYSTWVLVKMIQDNNWKIHGVEQSLTGTLQGVEVVGKADLVLTNEAGQFVVLDLKWSGGSRREKMIKSQEDLQLVMYARLLNEVNQWASTAYYIIKEGKMIARNNEAFKDALAVTPDDDPEAIYEVIWQRMCATYEWRKQQLKKGIVEVRTELTHHELNEPYEELPTFNDFLEMKNTNAPFDDFQTLINLLK